ncbi:hypothetical protein FDP41_011918 [Naegleria fowleri]|uniref:D-aminoacyl-tRNA deacylase n=1 Tax=Naegleria fowleri TaxID=5763 RepID=A0A6A5BXR2_NAEFO|nr:uncharacterized protein FDP41_011918 [Naegleria fowleri]KAF0982057.1 hypothetical protein FDP41_011918 [Naegleria fowleri]CAG4710108.1 unnamed protein product [Naegleria fowleri]
MSKARVILQNITSANLLMNNVDEWKSTVNNRGVVLYLSFMKGCTSEDVSKIVKQILQSKSISTGLDSKQAICELDNFDIVIVPQASIAGKLKDKNFQYYQLIDKDTGLQLYEHFVKEVHSMMTGREGNVIISGTYGNRQGLQFSSDGPYCHIFEV